MELVHVVTLITSFGVVLKGIMFMGEFAVTIAQKQKKAYK